MPPPSDGNRPTSEPETAALAGQLASPVDTSAGEQEGAALAAHPGLPLHGPVQPVHGPVQPEQELGDRQMVAGLAPPWEPTEAPLGTEEALTAKVPAANQQAKGRNLVEEPTVRRSARNKATADEHTLKKTARMAAKKNLESTGSSFTSFSDNRITSNLNNIGINLGSTASAIKSSNIAIKNLEIDRLALQASKILDKSKSKFSHAESDEEKEDRLEAVLSHVSGNLNENMQDKEVDHIIDLSPVRRKKKSTAAKNPKNGRLPKKPKTPSKIKLK